MFTEKWVKWNEFQFTILNSKYLQYYKKFRFHFININLILKQFRYVSRSEGVRREKWSSISWQSVMQKEL
jgi:hypothetical protein